ncbi:hypothetical protein [Wenyingzhuangia sp. 2_MG-2023]|uniref:hypothetical protein n=1 Tax=Wenyingzhuangia sp. 2_MG-2023 TaxID=3062639 RepID=UPI0026E21106|nr:hypothetical protein [Wenyingzhuangia sp. 2_MG-2023]MDO6737194.1 hypothetical protein [Wenyingzhuangia sp. 2_MG-2023]MDO6801728.1 hypothetical protein [Wenyingzhuangia sp. 1_MG-2023]
MKKFINTTILASAMFFATIVCASNPTSGGDDKLNNAHKIDTSIFSTPKVDYKEVKDVFRINKRVDRIFKPKKKLSKLKYTIA